MFNHEGLPNFRNIVDSLLNNPRYPNGWMKKRALKDIDLVCLHQAMGYVDSYSVKDVLGVHSYHTSTQCHINPGIGCPRICYHFVIDDDGMIYQCNELTDITWAARGANTTGIHILLIGNFSGPGYAGKGEPTTAQKAAYLELAQSLLSDDINLPSIYRQSFVGHCDFGKPACPGTVAYEWVRAMRGEL